MPQVRELLLNEYASMTVTSVTEYGLGAYGSGFYGSIGAAPNPPENSVKIGPVPMGVEWTIEAAIVSCTSATDTTFILYQNSVDDSGFIINGDGNNAYLEVSGHILKEGESLYGVWTNGDVGAVGFLRIRGIANIYWWAGSKYER